MNINIKKSRQDRDKSRKDIGVGKQESLKGVKILKINTNLAYIVVTEDSSAKTCGVAKVEYGSEKRLIRVGEVVAKDLREMFPASEFDVESHYMGKRKDSILEQYLAENP